MNVLALLCFFGCVAITLECGSSVKPRHRPHVPWSHEDHHHWGPLVPTRPQPPVTESPGTSPSSCGCSDRDVTLKNGAKISLLNAASTDCQLQVTCDKPKTNGFQTAIDLNSSEKKTPPKVDSNVIYLQCHAKQHWKYGNLTVVETGCKEEPIPDTCECTSNITSTIITPTSPNMKDPMITKNDECETEKQ